MGRILRVMTGRGGDDRRRARYVGHVIRNVAHHADDTIIGDAHCECCRFEDCVVTAAGDIRHRPVLRNLHLRDCEQRDCHLSQAIIEDVTVDGLRTKELCIVADCAFHHVTLKGRIDQLKITNGLAGRGGVQPRPQVQAAFDQANARYHASLDWAIDISGAEFTDFSLSGVPLTLLRLDMESQVVLPAELIRSGEWRRVSTFARVWGPRIDAQLRAGRGPEVLLVAAKRHDDFQAELAGIRELRSAGLIS